MKYTFKKSRRLAQLTDMEKNVSKDDAISEIKDFCENIAKLSVEDISPMGMAKIDNAIIINDRLHGVYGEESLISEETENRLKEMKTEFNKFDEEVYGYSAARYLDYLNKNNYTAYINEFKDDEWYLRDQTTDEEKGLLSEFTNEGINLKSKFGSKINLKNKKKTGGYGFIKDEDLAKYGIGVEEVVEEVIDESNMTPEEKYGLNLVTNKQLAMDKLKEMAKTPKIPKSYDQYISNDYE